MSSSALPRPSARAPLLAPFRSARLNIAPSVPDAGLAVFDAILAGPRGAVSMPRLPAALKSGSWRTRADLEVCPTARRCQSCGWMDVRRFAAHNLNDYLLSVFGLVPYRCRTCSDRFHRTRQTAPSPGRRSVEVSIMPSRTLKIPGNLSSHGLFAAGTYSRALASIAAPPGMCAASPAEWISDAPGQVRS